MNGQGQVLVEFALIAPVALVLTLGALELGFALVFSMNIANAAQTVAYVPSSLDAEVSRLGLDCTASISEDDGIRLVVLDCVNPLPLASGFVSPVLHGEATAPAPTPSPSPSPTPMEVP